MTQTQLYPKVTTTPFEIASQGVISNLMTTGGWRGDVPNSVRNHYGKMLKGEKKNIIPREYLENITSLTSQRVKLFSEYGIPTVFGRYMTMESAISWGKRDSLIISSLTKTYSNMAIDRDSLVINARKEGRQYAEKEWNYINPGQGSPSLIFCMETENRFEATVPSERDLSSARFWTYYHSPPPANSFPDGLEKEYKGTINDLSYLFARQVVAGLKLMINDYYESFSKLLKSSGEISTRLTSILPDKISIINDMYFPNDEETKLLIKNLKDTPFVCYKDASKMIEIVNELREKTVNLLDGIVIN